ncbi:MAG: phosphate signaling complex protein PhoU [bacterium]
MQRHFQRELESLKTTLVKMASIVEDSIVNAIRAVQEKQADIAEKVIQSDERVNDLETENDNSILDLLALQQPVAIDLRFIIAAQKINNDLERIGDHAVNIAQSTRTLMKLPSRQSLLHIPDMAEAAKTMLHDAIDSFIHMNPKKAQGVLDRDDYVDELNRAMSRKVIEMVNKDKKMLECGLELVRVSRNLERVADLTTNIAEEVIFLAQARIVKHHADEKRDTHR